MWFLGDPRVHLSTDVFGNVNGFEVRQYDDEITVKIEIKEVA